MWPRLWLSCVSNGRDLRVEPLIRPKAVFTTLLLRAKADCQADELQSAVNGCRLNANCLVVVRLRGNQSTWPLTGLIDTGADSVLASNLLADQLEVDLDDHDGEATHTRSCCRPSPSMNTLAQARPVTTQRGPHTRCDFLPHNWCRSFQDAASVRTSARSTALQNLDPMAERLGLGGP